MKETTRYKSVCVISVLFSILGVPFAAFVTRNAIDGGRGGAIGVAIALLFFFLNRDYGAKLYRALMQDLPELKARLERKQADPSNTNAVNVDKQVAQLEKEVTTLIRRINVEAEGQQTQGKALAVATFIGTILWGFGDAGAAHLMRDFGVQSAQAETLPIVLTDRCVVRGLHDPMTQQASGTGLVDLSDEDVTQAPVNCVDSIIARALHDQPILVLVEGRSDKRPLRPALKRIYGDNFTLAYQRGVLLKTYLIDHYRSKLPQSGTQGEQVKTFSSRIAVTAGGPNHIESKPSDSDESEDRCVEVFSYWNTKPNP